MTTTQLKTLENGRVTVHMDGDAGLHVWAPNHPDDTWTMDLTDQLARIVSVGLEARPPREAHWTDPGDGGVTLLIEASAGQHGQVLVDGHPISDEATVRLAAAGFMATIRRAVTALTDEHDEGNESDADDEVTDESADV